MIKKATGRYKVVSWHEESYLQINETQKNTVADIEFELSGDMQGRMTSKLTMSYLNDNHSVFNGISNFVGIVNGNKGQFVLISEGDYVGGIVNCLWKIISGSGSEELKLIQGSGSYTTGESTSVAYVLNYSLE